MSSTDPAEVTGTPAEPPVAALLERLARHGVRLWLEEGRVRVNAPKGVLDDALKAEIARRKEHIVAALLAAPPAPARAALARVDRGAPLPLSHTQQRLWFLKQMDPGNAAYNVPFALRLDGDLDDAALARTLDDLVQRHESLRTRFLAVDGTPACVCEPAARLDIARIDLSGLGAAERDDAMWQHVRRLTLQPFDITAAPLLRVALIRLAPRSHLFFMVVDHLVADGVSLGIFAVELQALYAQHAAGVPCRLRELPVQYVDVVAWQRRAFDDGALAGHLAYWKRQLADLPSLLPLPTDRPRPPVQTFRGARIFGRFPPALSARLRALARSEGATQFMVLLAAFQVLLHRYAGVTDVPVGTAVANRGHEAAEGVIGFFANNIVLRGDLSGRPTVRELLARVRQTCLHGMSHQEMPFDLLVDALGTRRELDHSPLFQVMFVLQSVATPRLELPGLQCEAVEIGSDTARFDLSVDVWDVPDGMHLSFEYNADLFDAATIERLVGHYQRLLEEVAERPDAPIDTLALLGEDERQRLLLGWRGPAQPVPEQTVHGLFEDQAARTPGRTAVRFEDTAWTYGELDARANRLAHHLRALGVGRGALVGVWLERSAEMVVALLGVLKAGGAYVPLDPAFPQDRIDYMMADAALGVVVTQASLAATLGAGGPRAVCMDADAALLAAQPAHAPAPLSGPPDLAYVIYTSGSTGRPKGVMLEHRSVVNFLRSMHREPGIAAQDRFVSVTTLSFDIAGLEIHGPLTIGATVVLAPRATAVDGVRLAALMDQCEATLLQATPATFRLLVESGWRGRAGLKMLCGGEALPRDLATRLLGLGGELWNMYGPTETTIWSTAGRVVDTSRTIALGRPIDNTQLYVFEPSGLPAPLGVAGELCIGGDGLARGYLHRDDLTAEKFVTLELPGIGAVRVYRTGDLVRLLADGGVEYLGRRDQQVKVRGFRIELGEIETVLAAQAGVKECVVQVREDRPGDQRLVGYVVCAAGARLDADDVRAALRRLLPDYMVPTLFVTLEALPLTPNGKVDRKALPAPQAQAAAGAADDAAQALMTPEQRRVAARWCEVLQLDRVGLQANFFDVGGHSLMLVRLQSALSREFGRDIALVELFQHTTVAAQAALLSAADVGQAALQRAQARARRQVHG